MTFSDRLVIFDTTLRDGEQAPGIALTPEEKVTIAHQLAKLRVDILEAGFAASSPGDFEAVTRIANEVRGPVIASLARAHPDDIDFGMAGTIATLTRAGAEVSYCLVTSGEAGPPDDAHRDELRTRREAEQRSAASVVGVHDVRFLGYPDGRVESNLALRRDLSRVIRDVQPDLVIAQSSDPFVYEFLRASGVSAVGKLAEGGA